MRLDIFYFLFWCLQEERGKVDSVTTLSELFSAAAKKEPKLGDIMDIYQRYHHWNSKAIVFINNQNIDDNLPSFSWSFPTKVNPLNIKLNQAIRAFPWFNRVSQSKFEKNQSTGSWVMIGYTNKRTNRDYYFIFIDRVKLRILIKFKLTFLS